jgi:ribosomal protein S21
VLKKKPREGLFREMRLRGHYENLPKRAFGKRRRRSAMLAGSLAKSCSARVCCLLSLG